MGTGLQSASVETSADRVSSIDFQFTLTIPITMRASEVDAALSASISVGGRRSEAPSFQDLLSTHMVLNGIDGAENVTVANYGTTAVVEPIVASAFGSYECPYPKNCIPASNRSVCAEGATGVACAVCEQGWVISNNQCMKCAGREGSPAMFAFLTGLLLLILAGVVFCDCSGDNDSGSDIEVEKHNETPMDSPTMWISQVSPTSQTPSVTAWSEISEGSQHGSGKGSGNSGGDVVEEISTRQLERELNEDDLQVLHDAAPNYKRNVEGGDAEKHIEVTDHVAADFGEEELQALGIGDKDNEGEI